MDYKDDMDIMIKKMESGTIRSPLLYANLRLGDEQIQRAIAKLSDLEVDVMNAVCTIANDCAESGEDMVFTIEEVHHIISGDSVKFTEERQKEICQIIDRLRTKEVKVDMAEAARRHGIPARKYERSSMMIYASGLKVSNGGKSSVCYILNVVPLLLRYAAETRQEIMVLKMPTRRT